MIRLALIALSAAAALASCGKVTISVNDDRTRVVEDVTALVERWASAGEAGDWDELKSVYADAPGFAWIERGAVAYKDHDAIVAGLDMARDMNPSVRNDVSNIVVTPLSDDAAALHADISMEMTTQTFAFAFDGVFSAVAVRRNGEWRFLQGAFSEKPAAADGER